MSTVTPSRVWMPHVTVATIVERNGRFLFVEEAINDEVVINQPAGHWEEGETFIEAALRETMEETGWKVEITGLVGIYEYKPPELDYAFVRFAYSAKPIEHDPQHVLEPGIKRWFWMDQNELRMEIYRHRSPMVQQCVEDYWMVKRWPLTLVNHQTVRHPADEATAADGHEGALALRRV
ncbi:MAG: NUDIX hydrolase [Pseudomonadota bacterium]